MFSKFLLRLFFPGECNYLLFFCLTKKLCAFFLIVKSREASETLCDEQFLFCKLLARKVRLRNTSFGMSEMHAESGRRERSPRILSIRKRQMNSNVSSLKICSTHAT